MGRWKPPRLPPLHGHSISVGAQEQQAAALRLGTRRRRSVRAPDKESNLFNQDRIDKGLSDKREVIEQFRNVSPQKHWVVAAMKRADNFLEGDFAIPLGGGPRLLLCESFCWPTWSPDGKYLYVPIQQTSVRGPGKTLAIPLGPGESIPSIPPERHRASPTLRRMPANRVSACSASSLGSTLIAANHSERSCSTF
jgi:hypothetical protein